MISLMFMHLIQAPVAIPLLLLFFFKVNLFILSYVL